MACPPFIKITNPLYLSGTYAAHLPPARGIGTVLSVTCHKHLLEEGTSLSAPEATCLANRTYSREDITTPCRGEDEGDEQFTNYTNYIYKLLYYINCHCYLSRCEKGEDAWTVNVLHESSFLN